MKSLVATALTAIAIAATIAAAVHAPLPAQAHGGGLDRCGCHHDRRAGTCHCHHDEGCGCECEPDRCHGRDARSPRTARAAHGRGAAEATAEAARVSRRSHSSKRIAPSHAPSSVGTRVRSARRAPK